MEPVPVRLGGGAPSVRSPVLPGEWRITLILIEYMAYEGPDLANQISRKLGVYARKLERSHSLFIVILIDINII